MKTDWIGKRDLISVGNVFRIIVGTKETKKVREWNENKPEREKKKKKKRELKLKVIFTSAGNVILTTPTLRNWRRLGLK